MDETLGDLARHDTVRQDRAKLIARHHSNSMLHRSRIVIENLNSAYGPGQVLKRVCIAVPQFQITALIGLFGCGTSNLLRVPNRTAEQQTLFCSTAKA